MADYETQYHEKKLRLWNPTKKNDATPKAELLVAKLSLKGTWTVGYGMESTSLAISPSRSGSYSVEFRTSGCLDGWRLHRTATFKDGTLLLNRPVEEYSPITYRRLFALRIKGKNYLVPDCSVDDFENQRSPFWNWSYDLFGFTRKP